MLSQSMLLLVTVTRLVMKDITLSDGSFIPKGHLVGWPSRATHMDERVYPNPYEFQGFRFADLREEEGESTKHQSVALGVEWTTWGGGKHAWYVSCLLFSRLDVLTLICIVYSPGRFFAINEVKAMLAYVLLNYDVKLADAERPPTLWLGTANIPNQKAHLLFRKRKQD